MDDRLSRFARDEQVQDLDDAAVDALVVVGVLSPHDAARRKDEQRRRRALVTTVEAPSAAALATGRALLADLFPATAAPADDDRQRMLNRFARTWLTLSSVGAVAPGDDEPYIERLLPREAEPRPRRPSGEPTGFAAAELQAVLIGPPDRLEGIRVTSIELYGDCVVVRLHVLSDPEAGGLQRVVGGDLTDDLGTDYQQVQIPGPGTACDTGDGRSAVDCWHVFVPGVPAGAGELAYSKAGEQIVLRIGDRRDPG